MKNELKPILSFILIVSCILGLSYAISTLCVSCIDKVFDGDYRYKEQQERLDNRNTIEKFLQYDVNNKDIRRTFWLPNFGQMVSVNGYTMYELLETIEYTEKALSKTPIHEYGHLIFSFDNNQEFVLLDNLEIIYVHDIVDGHLYMLDSYRYYSIKKEDGQKILELAERIVEEQNNENN